MKSKVAAEMTRLGLLAVFAAALCWSFNSLLPLLLACGSYIGWHLYQLFRLYAWLVQENHTEPPDSIGIWADLYTRFEHLFRKERTAQAQLTGIIDRARQSVNALEDGVMLISHRGRLEYFNQAAEELLGFRHQQDIDQIITNLIRDPRFSDYLHKAQFKEPLDIESPRQVHRRLQFRITEFGPGDRLILVRDVSRLHHLEQMRKDFVANVSHELKTPLTVLKGYLETLADSVPKEQARLHRALNQMQQQSSRMEALVHDLLLLSRLENTEAEGSQHAVLLQPMLKRMREDALALSGDKQHQVVLDVPEDARLLANPAELESALGNLITNAVKYTPAHGEIYIGFRQNDNGVDISVSDDGDGIDPAHIPRLTERFYRPDNSRHSRTGGTGLGLAIVKHVMLRHQGDLRISSTLGNGSTFTCHFPAQRRVTRPAAIAG